MQPKSKKVRKISKKAIIQNRPSPVWQEKVAESSFFGNNILLSVMYFFVTKVSLIT